MTDGAFPENTGRNQDGTFAKGVSGNPAGKPKGARTKLTESFLDVLLADFVAAHDGKTQGAEAIRVMRAERPNEYAKMIAGLLAKEVDAGDDLKDFMSVITRRVVDPNG